MNKKIIFSVIAIMLVVALINGCAKKITPIEVLQGGKVEKKEKAAVVGQGWSVKDSESEAVQEAVSMMLGEMEGKPPEYVLFFMKPGSEDTPGYDPNKILSGLRNLLGPNVKVHGMTSAIDVLDKYGKHSGDVGAITMMGISSPRIKFGVGGVDIDDYETPEEAGKAAILDAMRNAGEEGLPQVIYSTLVWSDENRIIEGIESVIGKEVPMFGGNSGDNDFTERWNQFANDRVYKKGIVLTVFYTDLKVGYAFDLGYIRSEYRGVVTKSDNKEHSRIFEIDNRPAFDVYDEWTKGLIGSGVTFQTHQDTTFFPLMKVVYNEQGNPYYIATAVIGTDNETGTIDIGTTLKTGNEVILTHGTWEILVNRAQSTTHKAKASKNIAKDDVLFGIYSFCGGTYLGVPDEERSKIPLLIEGELDAPFIGAIVWGEQVFSPGLGVQHANMVNSILIFGEK